VAPVRLAYDIGSPEQARDVPFVPLGRATGARPKDEPMDSIAIPVGIDVSKDTLDTFMDRPKGRKRMKCRNDEDGARAIVAELQDGGPYRIAMEATGRYESLLFRKLEEAGFEAAVQNPRLARHLAIGLGVEVKTDPIDAENLALTATVCKRTVPRSRLRESLGDMERTISSLTQERSAHKKRLQVPGFDLHVAEIVETIVAALDAQIARLERLFEAEVRKSVLAERYKLCQTVPGVGPATARVFVAELPEDLSGWTIRQICSYAGLTPLDNASGKSVKRSRLKLHGNMFLKAATYMPAVNLLARDPQAKALYARLREHDRSHRQAIVPIMHLVARRVAAVVKRGSPWQGDPPERT
jgi:transposase